jgi:hypothetical protein
MGISGLLGDEVDTSEARRPAMKKKYIVLSDEVYCEVERIVLVQDNLNTHSPASL